MPHSPEFAAVFKDLRAILAEYEPKLKVVHDKPDHYYLDTFTIGPNKRPIMFGGGPRPEELRQLLSDVGLWPDRPARRDVAGAEKAHAGQGVLQLQGRPIAALFKELAAITKSGYQAWKKMEWVE